MAYYECADKKHTIKINCQMAAPNTGHQCTVSVYNDNKLIDTLRVAQLNNSIGAPLHLSKSYTI